MTMLPWDDWFYHLSAKETEIRTLFEEGKRQQYSIEDSIPANNQKLENLQTVVARNAAMMILLGQISMKKDEYAKFRLELEGASPPEQPPPGRISEIILETADGGITVTILGILFKKGSLPWLKQTGSSAFQILKKAITRNRVLPVGEIEEVEEIVDEDVSEGLSDAGVDVGVQTTAEITEATVGEAVTEAASLTTFLAASVAEVVTAGVGICVFIGVDAIGGAISGAEESKQLAHEKAQLKTAIAKLQGYVQTLKAKTDKIDTILGGEERRFISLLNILSTITGQAPTFSYVDLKVGGNVQAFIAAQAAAIHQYGILLTLKTDWIAAQQRKPSITKEEFIKDFMILAPPELTEKTAMALFMAMLNCSDKAPAALA